LVPRGHRRASFDCVEAGQLMHGRDPDAGGVCLIESDSRLIHLFDTPRASLRTAANACLSWTAPGTESCLGLMRARGSTNRSAQCSCSLWVAALAASDYDAAHGVLSITRARVCGIDTNVTKTGEDRRIDPDLSSGHHSNA
jgi:hypothetical protein